MTKAPYAGPSVSNVAAESAPAGNARGGLYVPASWRAAPLASRAPQQAGGPDARPPEPLPSIGAFLAETDGSGVEPKSGPRLGDRDSVLSDADAPLRDDPAERPDDWPFADAAATTTELTGEMRVPEPTVHGAGDTVTPPLPMWQDDDLLDIMPPPTALSAADAPWSPAGKDSARPRAPYAGPAESATVGREGNESAARALESLAHRVRNGELLVPGYVPELGDAAALAAALAALLGIRGG